MYQQYKNNTALFVIYIEQARQSFTDLWTPVRTEHYSFWSMVRKRWTYLTAWTNRPTLQRL